MADDVDPRRVADDDGDGRGDYAPPSLQEVARRRAIQTALVGLGIDVAVALSVLWLSVVDTLTTGEAWAALGITVGKTIITTAAQYVLRRFVDQSGYHADGTPKT